MFFKEAKVDDGLWLERLVQKGWDESELMFGVAGYVLEMPKLAISLNSAAPFSRSVSLVLSFCFSLSGGRGLWWDLECRSGYISDADVSFGPEAGKRGRRDATFSESLGTSASTKSEEC